MLHPRLAAVVDTCVQRPGLDNGRGSLYAPPPMAARPSLAHWHCERCVAWIVPLRPHWGWHVAYVASWVVIPGLLFFAHKGPGIVMLPLVCMMAAGLFGPLRGKSHAEARCPACRCYVPRPE